MSPSARRKFEQTTRLNDLNALLVLIFYGSKFFSALGWILHRGLSVCGLTRGGLAWKQHRAGLCSLSVLSSLSPWALAAWLKPATSRWGGLGEGLERHGAFMILQLTADRKILTPYSEHEAVCTQKLNAKALKQESMNPGLTLHRGRNYVCTERGSQRWAGEKTMSTHAMSVSECPLCAGLEGYRDKCKEMSGDGRQTQKWRAIRPYLSALRVGGRGCSAILKKRHQT